MLTLEEKQDTDIARLTTDLQGTRELTPDQIESRAWMREAVAICTVHVLGRITENPYSFTAVCKLGWDNRIWRYLP